MGQNKVHTDEVDLCKPGTSVQSVPFETLLGEDHWTWVKFSTVGLEGSNLFTLSSTKLLLKALAART